MNICPFCQAGHLRRRSVAYLQWHDRRLLVVERMPALVCERCSELIYDTDAVERLQQLLWAAPLRRPNRSHLRMV